jgi:hypothetical protein
MAQEKKNSEVQVKIKKKNRKVPTLLFFFLPSKG